MRRPRITIRATKSIEQEVEQAIELMRQALTRRPDVPELHSGLAEMLQAVSRYDEAIAEYQTALGLGPDDPGIRHNLGNALQARGRPEEAVSQYRMALALRPSHAQTLLNLGAALQSLNRLDEAVLQYEAALAVHPDFAEAHNNLGATLRALNRADEAVLHYEAALRVRPDYADAHTNLGNISLAVHHYEEAVQHYRAALRIDPRHVTAHNNLGTALQALNRPDEAMAEHQAALELDPNSPFVHQALAVLLLREGKTEAAYEHGQIGFNHGIEGHPYRGVGTAVSVLVLQSALGGHVVTEQWFDDQTFQKWTVTAEFCDAAPEFPPHQLVFNAIGEADLCATALSRADTLLQLTKAPVLNLPSRVLATSRVVNAARLAQLPGVVTAKTVLRSRQSLLTAGAAAELARDGFTWPLLLRLPGFHTGENFLKVDGPGQLAAAAQRLPGDEVLVIQFLDLFDSAGKVRKYRVLFVDGRLYPLHLAISTRWMVHFMHADMADYPEHRAEDAAFLDDMRGFLGPKVMSALDGVRKTLGLDYAGIDFGVDDQNRVVVFEANATMVAPLPGSDERWAYRRPAIERVHRAVRTMLLTRSGAAGNTEV